MYNILTLLDMKYSIALNDEEKSELQSLLDRKMTKCRNFNTLLAYIFIRRNLTILFKYEEEKLHFYRKYITLCNMLGITIGEGNRNLRLLTVNDLPLEIDTEVVTFSPYLNGDSLVTIYTRGKHITKAFPFNFTKDQYFEALNLGKLKQLSNRGIHVIDGNIAYFNNLLNIKLNTELLYHFTQYLRANYVLEEGVDYFTADGTLEYATYLEGDLPTLDAYLTGGSSDLQLYRRTLKSLLPKHTIFIEPSWKLPTGELTRSIPSQIVRHSKLHKNISVITYNTSKLESQLSELGYSNIKLLTPIQLHLIDSKDFVIDTTLLVHDIKVDVIVTDKCKSVSDLQTHITNVGKYRKKNSIRESVVGKLLDELSDLTDSVESNQLLYEQLTNPHLKFKSLADYQYGLCQIAKDFYKTSQLLTS